MNYSKEIHKTVCDDFLKCYSEEFIVNHSELLPNKQDNTKKNRSVLCKFMNEKFVKIITKELKTHIKKQSDIRFVKIKLNLMKRNFDIQAEREGGLASLARLSASGVDTFLNALNIVCGDENDN